MRCPVCEWDNPPEFSFCGRCGAPLQRRCPRCGFEGPGNLFFCGRCGAEISGLVQPFSLYPWQGERTFAVILFVDIAGFTRLSERMDPEEATALLNSCLEQMTTAVVRQGGRISQYTGDGLLAVFGIPVQRDDDPVRALRAALDVVHGRPAVAGVDAEMESVGFHAGAACGQVLAALVGSGDHKEHALVGRPVNLAARLEEASAPGQILVSDDLAHRTQTVFSFRHVPDVALSGWGQEVQAFELLGERNPADR